MLKPYAKKRAESEATYELCELIESKLDVLKEELEEVQTWIKNNEHWDKDEGYNKPWQWESYLFREEEIPVKIATLEKIEKELLK